MTDSSTRAADSLQDRYSTPEGWVYLTGMQALVRLPLQQHARDAAAGLNTGGYISGYRGSPMGRYDMELWGAKKELGAANVVFRPGLNEELAATAIWGSQYVGSFPGAKVDGVFGIWYGKGPGVDRSADALRHANLAGTSPHGGVVCLAGDDHGAKSSTVANFSDPVFIAVGMPVLYPSNTQEVLDYGLHGIAMSRYSGCWVGLKLVTDVVEGGGSVYVAADSPRVTLPERPSSPKDMFGEGVSIRGFDMPLAQEDRLYHHKLAAAMAYARANALNEITAPAPEARLGIVSAGKSWQDVLQALANMGIHDAAAAGIRLLKLGMIWPLDPAIVHEFAQGLSSIVVVEEKRPLIEEQLRAALYGSAGAPHIIGKHVGGTLFDPARGAMAFPNAAEISPGLVAQVLAGALQAALPGCALHPVAATTAKGPTPGLPGRNPGFCSGCPHSRSTRVPEGSRALAGIGCHTMAMLVNPRTTSAPSQMGGEGMHWLGQQPFTTEKHVFANLGDGTFSHSGHLAVRQAVAAGVPITYKLLYNGFNSMTGGQPTESGQSPAMILASLAGEGIKKMAVVTDEPEKYQDVGLPFGVAVHHRSQMDTVMREMREYPGVSLILYDQPCATERRRLRKRGKWADPAKRSFINPAVCEGCGDCGQVSGCMSIEPLETELGRKRRINQASCNKDYTCTEGFCPSFVTVHGGSLRKAAKAGGQDAPQWTAPLPEPQVPALSGLHSVLVGGIGGTGVVTIGQTLAVAAHLEGAYSSNLDITGLSQKYGAVLSHVRFAPAPELLHATRIATGEGHTMIGCDLIVAAGDEPLRMMNPTQGQAVVCTDMVPTADFTRNPDWQVDATQLTDRINGLLGERALLLEGQRLATALLGDPIAANMFMLGAAWQRGQIPLKLASIDRAIELNGVAIPMNKSAFLWGRRAAHDLAAVEQWVKARTPAVVVSIVPRIQHSLEDLMRQRTEHLSAHTGSALAERYRAFVSKVRAAEGRLKAGDLLSRTVAHNYHRLLAVKDEWEVARLYSHPDFKAALEREFEGDYTLHFHLGAWPFAKTDPATGKIQKAELGPWMLKAMGLMARFKGLRGSWLDPFRNNEERRLDQQLLAQYEADIEALLPRLDATNRAMAVKLAALPESIRGYGHVKAAQAEAAATRRRALLSEQASAPAAVSQAA
ncbi:indolepyruvate ferredoxin oxidoreductase [Paucibacter oligotrophus]|uniref:Indolepyruvate ferredoxin oxidoreductase n=1 Tax=Roseateles oligotrophus TaxID=1769250 RepID=A0A840L6M0_9BURK|nr:indolepyruvate ferredoxin oxidoreductase family protein [Roseateles oligotrophus]MBB4843676.1 indolepyruvate ferredoxin oxidoreductase [Roseateles oligotrophus]